MVQVNTEPQTSSTFCAFWFSSLFTAMHDCWESQRWSGEPQRPLSLLVPWISLAILNAVPRLGTPSSCEAPCGAAVMLLYIGCLFWYDSHCGMPRRLRALCLRPYRCKRFRLQVAVYRSRVFSLSCCFGFKGDLGGAKLRQTWQN